jgi:hypothetical protein
MLEEDGYTPAVFNNDQWVADVAANLIQSSDEAYADTENYGVDLTIAAGGTWYVTGTSTLSSLTIEAGGQILSGSENQDVVVYVNCDASNSLLSYDYSNATKLSDLAPGTYENVAVVLEAAQPSTPSTPSATFSDVAANAWYASYVADVAAKEIVNGYEDGTFRPENTLTRAEAAKMIVLAAGLTVDESATTSFSDANGAWYTPYIAAAAKAGIVNGYGDGTFNPGGEVTRAELAKMIVAAKGLATNENATTSFTDGNGAWFTPYIAAAVDAGIVNGYEDGTVKPNANIKRSEAAKMISLGF